MQAHHSALLWETGRHLAVPRGTVISLLTPEATSFCCELNLHSQNLGLHVLVYLEKKCIQKHFICNSCRAIWYSGSLLSVWYDFRGKSPRESLIFFLVWPWFRRPVGGFSCRRGCQYSVLHVCSVCEYRTPPVCGLMQVSEDMCVGEPVSGYCKEVSFLWFHPTWLYSGGKCASLISRPKLSSASGEA